MAVTWYIGESPSAQQTVSGPAATERADWLTAVSAYTLVEDDLSTQDLTENTTVVTLATGMGQMTSTRMRVRAVSPAARFNTSGSPARWIASERNVAWQFPASYGAGLYITDPYDFPSSVTVQAWANGVLVDSLALDNNTLESPNLWLPGGLLFVGFLSTTQIDELRVEVTHLDEQEGFDFLGYDSFALATGDPVSTTTSQLQISRGWGRNQHVLTIRMVTSSDAPLGGGGGS